MLLIHRVKTNSNTLSVFVSFLVLAEVAREVSRVS